MNKQLKKEKDFIDYVFSLDQLSIQLRSEICRLYMRDKHRLSDEIINFGKEKT